MKRPKKRRSPLPSAPAALTVAPLVPLVPVVGVGASAGGLEAFERFLAGVDAASGLAYVFIQHLSRDFVSVLPELLVRYSHVPVLTVVDRQIVEANRVYVLPPNYDVVLEGDRLRLLPASPPHGVRYPVDVFLRSLAHERGARAICVVLSGTGGDGTLGVRAVKGEGGLAVAQDPTTAAFDGMPQSVIGTGLVDLVLAPEDMPARLVAYAARAFAPGPAREPTAPDVEAASIDEVLVALREATGHDFTLYRRNTVLRRIQRRVAVNRLDGLDAYAAFVREHAEEAEALFHELLIGVTRFFRDADAFAAVAEQALPALLEGRSDSLPVRVWVPGCSTGEEAYSLVILLLEQARLRGTPFKVQVFATDVDPSAVATARAGVYPEGIAADMPPDLLSRYFTASQHRDEHEFRVKKDVRDLVIFAVQDVLKDPPFFRLDLISCRNLLIYLKPELQRRLLPLFHRALGESGFLLLGSSETVGELTDMFTSVDRRWNLFRRRAAPGRPVASVLLPQLGPRPAASALPPPSVEPLAEARPRPASLQAVVEQTLREHVSPPCVLVDRRQMVLYVHGSTGRYLEPAQGEAPMSVAGMAREGLRVELPGALREAAASGRVVVRPGVRVVADDEERTVDLTVVPVRDGPPDEAGLMLVVFQERASRRVSESAGAAAGAGDELTPEEARARVAELSREAATARDSLRAIIAEHEEVTQDLKSANEELQAANEELQSANEELQTSQEELQSANEELQTVNAELGSTVQELSDARDDLTNLLASTEIGTIFLDQSLRVLRFTPAAARSVALIPTDVGRPLSDLVTRLSDDRLVEDAAEVLASLVPIERQVGSHDGRWYTVRTRPYRTSENVVAGVVLTFVDVTEQRFTQERLQTFHGAIDQAPCTIVVTDLEGRIEYVNPKFVEVTGRPREESLGLPFGEALAGGGEGAPCLEPWSTAAAGREWRGELAATSKDGGQFWLSAVVSPVRDDDGTVRRLVLVADVRRS